MVGTPVEDVRLSARVGFIWKIEMILTEFRVQIIMKGWSAILSSFFAYCKAG
jgi:hypothetical protein